MTGKSVSGINRFIALKNGIINMLTAKNCGKNGFDYFQSALSEKDRNLIQRFSQLKSIFDNCRSETICSIILIKLVSVFIKKMIFIGGEWIGINKRCICYWHNSLISHNPLKKLFKAKKLCYSIKKITARFSTILHESGVVQQYFSIHAKMFQYPRRIP